MSESAPPTYTMPDGFGVVAALTIAPENVASVMSPETTVRWTPARSEFRTHRIQRGFARPPARGDGRLTLRNSLVGEEVGLVAGDEDDASACRHQRHSHQRKAPLGIAVEALRVPEVGAQLEADRRVEDQGVQSPEASRDGVDHRCGLSLIGDVGAQRRGVPACAADGVGNGFRTLGFSR